MSMVTHYVLGDKDKMASWFKEVRNAGREVRSTPNTSLSVLSSWVSPDVRVYAVSVAASLDGSKDRTAEVDDIVTSLRMELMGDDD
jgi:hypothetical protein